MSDKKRVRRGEQITALRILKRRRRELQPTQLSAGRNTGYVRIRRASSTKTVKGFCCGFAGEPAALKGQGQTFRVVLHGRAR